MSLFDNINEARDYIQSKIDATTPSVGIIVGSGQSDMFDDANILFEINYDDIPHFPKSTVESHRGKLYLIEIAGVHCWLMAGRWHYYEGYSMKEVTLPTRVLKALGCDTLVITNVSGSVNPSYQAGEIILIKDHINMLTEHPLRGKNDDRLGVRFPDMMHTYCKSYRNIIKEHAIQTNISIKEGIYLALQGPSLETPAEYEMIHRLGADLVGMSTVPEVIVARHAGMDVVAFSIVSNVCYPLDRLTETTIEEVIAVAKIAGKNLAHLIASCLPELAAS